MVENKEMFQNFGENEENEVNHIEKNENFIEISSLLIEKNLDNYDFKLIKEPEKIDYENIILESNKGKELNFSKSFKSLEADSEELKEILYESKEFYLNKILYKKFLSKNKKLKNIYLLNKKWYENWKKYVNYGKIKRTSENSEIYLLKNPKVKFKIDENFFPGKINNIELLNINESDLNNNNLIISDYFPLKDNLNYSKGKKDFIICSKRMFDLFKNRFGFDFILKYSIYDDLISIFNQNSNFNYYNLNEYNFEYRMIDILILPNKNNFENEINSIKKYNIYLPLRLSHFYFNEYLNSIINKIYNNNNNNIFNVFKNKDMICDEFLNFVILQNKEENIKKIKENLIIDWSGYLKKIPDEFTVSNLFSEITDFIVIELLNDNNNNDSYIIALEKCENCYEQNKYVNNIINNNNNINNNNVVIINNNGNNFSDSKQNNFYNNNNNNYNIDSDDNLSFNSFDLSNNLSGLVGLKNLGNTCYLNSALQSLSNIFPLTNYFLLNYHTKNINKENPIGFKGELCNLYSTILKNLWYGKKDFIKPKKFFKKIGEFKEEYNNHNQHDSQEFLSFILDGLHEDLNLVKKKVYREIKEYVNEKNEFDEFNYYFKYFKSRNQSIIIDFFYGFFKSTLLCPNSQCKNVSKSYDPFNIISLSIIEKSKILKLKTHVFYLDENYDFNNVLFNLKIKQDFSVKNFMKKLEHVLNINFNYFEIYKNYSNELVLCNDLNMNLIEFLQGDFDIYVQFVPFYVFNNNNEKYVLENMNKIKNNNNLIFEREKEFDDNFNNNFNNKNDVIMDDNTYNFNKNEWVKMRIYNFSYNIENNNNNIHAEKKVVNFPIFIYTNIEWNNKLLFEKLFRIFFKIFKNNNNNITNNENDELNDNNINEQINKHFPNLETCYNKILKNKYEKFKLKNHKLFCYPFILVFQAYHEIKENLLSLQMNEKNVIFNIYDSNKNILKLVIEKNKNNSKINECEFIFKIIWFPDFIKNLSKLNEKEIIEEKNAIEEEINTKANQNNFNNNNNNNADLYVNNLDYENNSIQNQFYYDNKQNDNILLLSNNNSNDQNNNNFSNENSNNILYNKNFFNDNNNTNNTINNNNTNNTNNNNINNNNNNTNNNNSIELESLLENFYKIEILSDDNKWLCPKCKTTQNAIKKITTITLPKILIFHLKRFNKNNKLNDKINFPLYNLDMNNYITFKDNKINNYSYDLVCIINHMGSLNGGHYTAFCKNYYKNKWFCFNDETVYEINENDVNSENAYVLFYQLKDIDNINLEDIYNKQFEEIIFDE